MRVDFDRFKKVVRNIKFGDWRYVFDKEDYRIKSCVASVTEKFKDECEFLIVQKMGNGYNCWLFSKPGKNGYTFNEKRGYEFGTSWKELQELMKAKHSIIIPSDRQIENMEDFVSRVNGNGIDLRNYEEVMEYVEY